MTEFPSDQPAEHPTGFPVESEPAERTDPETEPGGGEPDFDSEPDRGGALESDYVDPEQYVDPDATTDPTDIPQEVTDWESPPAFTPTTDKAETETDAEFDAEPDAEFVPDPDQPADGFEDDSAVAEELHDVEVADEERGHPLVEETMGRLDELRDRPVSEHAEVYSDLQERLQSALAEADRADAADRG